VFYKSSLYVALARRTTHQIVSGANLDDLGKHRPGLDAARQFGVRHPFIEAEIDKPAVLRLAATLGLGTLADLPAALSFSSRIETGIRIEGQLLEMVQQAERLVGARLSPRAVRCLVRAPNGVRCVVIELDEQTLAQLDAGEAERLQIEVQALAARVGVQTVAFAADRRG
jgi:uncharacterized protein